MPQAIPAHGTPTRRRPGGFGRREDADRGLVVVRRTSSASSASYRRPKSPVRRPTGDQNPPFGVLRATEIPRSAGCRRPESPGQRLPDADAVLGVEPEAVAGLYVERLVELDEVAGDVGAELRGAVRVGGEVLHRQLLATLGAPHVGPVQEQPLRAGEAVADRDLLALERDEVRTVADRQAAEVADVLTDGQGAVDVL